MTSFERNLAAFAVLDPTHLPVHFVQVFMFAARCEPCSYQQVMEALDLTNSAVSRTVAAFGETHRKGRAGFGLLYTVKDPSEGRRLLIRLTPKGKALYRQICP